MNFSVFLVVITIFQALAISPIKSMGFSNRDLIVFTPGFLMVTSGMAYYPNSLLNNEPSKNLTYSLVIILIAQFLIFYFLTGKIQKKFFNSVIIESRTFKDKKKILFVLACLLTMALVILHSEETTNYFISSNKVVDDLRDNRQLLFSFTYSLEGTSESKIGMFYPWGGSFIPSLVVTHLPISTELVNILYFTFISIFAFYSQMYIITKNLEIPFSYTSFLFLISMTFFPIRYIYNLPFSSTYGIIGALTLINIYLRFSKHFDKSLKLFSIGIFVLILLPLHPSSIFTFGIILIGIRLLFPELNSNKEIMKLGINKKSLFMIVFIFTFSIYNTIKKSDFLFILNGTLVPFLLRQPSQNLVTIKANSLLTTNPVLNTSTSFEQFLQEKSILNRIFGYLWHNVFTLSFYTYSIPVFLVMILIIIYSFKIFKKKFSYLLPLFIYLYLIMSASVSGIGSNVSLFSLSTIPFYQSPIRITHLGVLIYFLYFARFIKDMKLVQKR
jgi:hypothetical protein